MSYSGRFISFVLLVILLATSCDIANHGPDVGPGVLAPPEYAKLENSEFPGSLHVGMNTDYNRYLEPLGTLYGLLVFADFPNARFDDHSNQLKSIQDYADYILSNANQFFLNASYNRFKIELDFLDFWIRMPNEDSYYNLRRGDSLSEASKFRIDALSQAAAHRDMTEYDFFVIIPPDHANSIELSLASSAPVHISDSLSVNHTVIIGNEGHRDIDHLKLVHEILHLTGLPDLYDGFGTNDFTGGYDIMSTIYSGKLDNFAWLKWKMGWIDDHQVNVINSPGITEHILSPLARPDDQLAKMVVIITSSRTAFVLENRIAEKNDRLNLRDQGLLIYTVDVDIPTSRGPVWVINPYEKNNVFNHRALNLEPGRVSTYQNDLFGISISVLEMNANGNIKVEVIQYP